MKREKEKYPIPEWCKADCIFRDKKAKYMPACQYPFKLDISRTKMAGAVCLTYKKKEIA